MAKATNYDGKRVLSLIGEDIEGALRQSINEFQSPALSPTTVDRKGFSKPLIDTSDMLDSITHEVKE